MVGSDENEFVTKLVFGLDEPIAAIQKAISDFVSGQRVNIAILALPYAGKSELVDEIVKMHPHEVTKVTFSAIMDNKDQIPLLKDPTRIMIFDNCHYLYMRKIGGFDVIEEFLNMVLSSDKILYITTWNIHSWNYLDRVLDIGRYFPVQVKIPSLNPADMKEFLLSAYNENEIQFVNDIEVKKEKIFQVVKRPIAKNITRGKVNLYSLRINYVALQTLLFNRTPSETAESIIFKEIAKISRGNPGVAKDIWNKWLEYPVIKTSNINTVFSNIDLDSTGRFVLYIILSMGHIKKAELKNIILNWTYNVDDMMINKIIFEMLNQDLIAKNDEYYSVKPEKLSVVVKYLENIRLVW
ncbi:hypothetical protein [Methanomethylovorans sp.]|uniref:hypothetical protein n=1 Tax=Methanomethylovorans sp. TaxID=2758717 RepID=UPI00351C9ABA